MKVSELRPQKAKIQDWSIEWFQLPIMPSPCTELSPAEYWDLYFAETAPIGYHNAELQLDSSPAIFKSQDAGWGMTNWFDVRFQWFFSFGLAVAFKVCTCAEFTVACNLDLSKYKNMLDYFVENQEVNFIVGKGQYVPIIYPHHPEITDTGRLIRYFRIGCLHINKIIEGPKASCPDCGWSSFLKLEVK